MNSDANIYKEDINFIELAARDADFAKVLKSNGQLDFSDPEAVRQLTKALLKRDFNLSLTLPPDRLCPPVPNRLNYILWIQDLLDTTSESYSDHYDPRREVTGLDIGTGASCIYPLLGCAQRPNWRFVATDIDDLSLKYAQENIKANNLLARIKLLCTTQESHLIPLDSLGLETIDFTICNPPFYSSTSELLASAAQKSRPPNSACTGSASEMVTPGGETSFARQLVRESQRLRERVQWYTTMLGKLSSVPVVIELLQNAGVGNYAVTEFVQGSKTRRWAVGWSFGALRPSVCVARGVGGGGVPKSLLPFPGEYVVVLAEGDDGDVARVGGRVNAILEALPLQWMWKAGISTGVGFATGNVWSRSARRRSARGQAGQRRDEGSEGEDEMTFGFKMTVRELGGVGIEAEKNDGKGVQVVVRWLKGLDSTLFESFCGMVKRKLEG